MPFASKRPWIATPCPLFRAYPLVRWLDTLPVPPCPVGPICVTNFEISFPLHFQSFSTPGNRSPARPNATLESAICMHHQNPAAPPASTPSRSEEHTSEL